MTEILINREQIAEKIKELALKITQDFKGQDLVLVGILDGAFMLMADLSRELYKLGLKEMEVTFLGISSYGQNRESSKNPKITKDLRLDIKDRNVLIVEDIVDTGFSLDFLQRFLKERNPKILKTLVLLSKSSRREVDIKLDYIGFEIENVWVEGYGLDTDYLGRGNPDIIKRFS